MQESFFFDEPTSMLDPKAKKDFLDFFNKNS
ncbi:hypothetical protein Q757_05770 [Oenococcus alcoholitolerans]|uniref:ABC transporter ATP-binding protein n=1 Tax=Oenococcus alcoholitolerans TaxID=931074 RepID=A0ABR4XQL8_9LACO|nr:hypothetical protein Q757_05770 [Oenococcus alcoholitolerans]